MAKFGVMIPNWNGEAFIERCLGSVYASLRRAGILMDTQVLVVDDASSDRSASLIAASFPQVSLIRLERNVGFGRAVVLGLESIDAEWVFLLNNDLALQTEFCHRLIQTLDENEGQSVFAIGAQTRDWGDQTPNHSGQKAVWRHGLLIQSPFEATETTPTDFFQAGACLIHRKKFLELGGFADIYYPGYWEDYDIAWQARQRGWLNLYEPRAVAFHGGKGSMRKLLGDFGLSLVIRRNHLLFVWANLQGTRQMISHFLRLPWLIFNDRPQRGQASMARAFFSALKRLPKVLRLRRKRKRKQLRFLSQNHS